jgi:hypothetical protein
MDNIVHFFGFVFTAEISEPGSSFFLRACAVTPSVIGGMGIAFNQLNSMISIAGKTLR